LQWGWLAGCPHPFGTKSVQPLLVGRLGNGHSLVVELQSSSASVRAIRRGPVGRQAIEDNAAPWGEGSRDGLLSHDVCVADLPVSPIEVRKGARVVPSWAEEHAAVFLCRLIKRGPDSHNRGRFRNLEVGVVLVPRLFAADARRLQQSHVLEHPRGLSKDSVQDWEQIWVIDHPLQPLI